MVTQSHTLPQRVGRMRCPWSHPRAHCPPVAGTAGAADGLDSPHGSTEASNWGQGSSVATEQVRRSGRGAQSRRRVFWAGTKMYFRSACLLFVPEVCSAVLFLSSERPGWVGEAVLAGFQLSEILGMGAVRRGSSTVGQRVRQQPTCACGRPRALRWEMAHSLCPLRIQLPARASMAGLVVLFLSHHWLPFLVCGSYTAILAIPKCLRPFLSTGIYCLPSYKHS